ncbi:hypothetical protein K490DRAFT_43537 [Saccharata proteae CBS 121410]|uniref:Autophagy-related protein 11 n=1 Tax=Saccharata proteae CBS 121410 TaxID=1314787 RepID=A0A9P4HVG6_9PEZI|nr:hypothetical protein K490DRAFT_43537 [Saccharata proteae CBS 121410]
MALQLYLAHTGHRLEADPIGFGSMESLRAWIQHATDIPAQSQILLTAKGKHVKFQTLMSEVHLNAFVTASSLPEEFRPEPAPDTIKKPEDLRAWHALFKARVEWGSGLVDKCRAMAHAARGHLEERVAVDRGVRAAILNQQPHIQKLEVKQAEAHAWIEAVLKEREDNLNFWQEDLARLGSIPAYEQFRRFIAGPNDTPKKSRRSVGSRTTLGAFVNGDQVEKAAIGSAAAVDELGGIMTSIDSRIEQVVQESRQFVNDVGSGESQSLIDQLEEPSRLFNEIDLTVKKMGSDLDYILNLPANPASAAQASKKALRHTRDFLPDINEFCLELSNLLRYSVEQKNLATQNAIDHMKHIALLSTELGELIQEVDNINVAPEGRECLELLSLVPRLPLVYGLLLVEAVRRQEWVDKMKKDSSSLAEEIAGYREEEDRRRKRWLKSNGDVLNVEAAQGNILGIDINIQGQDASWPQVARQDLQEYLDTLRNLGGLEQDVEILSQAVKDLDRPTRQQVKNAKNFRNGSLHGASLGKGSLLLRGEDETRVLREVNSKMEEELRSSKSRVRKLEDLLHRQSQFSRYSIGSAPPSSQSPGPSSVEPHPTFPSSPKPHDNLSRQSSVSSRRYSSQKSAEEMMLTRKIINLEADLMTERETRNRLEREAANGVHAVNDLQRHVDEKKSTNKDLMENMEHMQKDFAEERRALEAEIRRLKYRNEELEDELDRNLGSRDNERAGLDEKQQTLEAELEQLRKEATKDARRERERAESLERILAERDAADAQRHTTLINAYSTLAPDEPVLDDPAILAAELERLAQRSNDHVRELFDAVERAKAENETNLTSAEREREHLEHQIESTMAKLSAVQDELSAELARTGSLVEQLEDERIHLNDLRQKFAEGETGSEALRQRLNEEEIKVGQLTTQLAETNDYTEKLRSSLCALQEQHDNLQGQLDALTTRFQENSSRAREVSEKLFTHNHRLHRLLETLGFAVTYQDNAMVVQRASRIGNSTMLSADGSVSMDRSASSPLPAKKPLESSADLSTLKWTEQKCKADEAAMYAQFLASIGRFDIETFSEAIIKRMRDMEHTARKWQRETRAYREKSHRFQGEAHDKIAIRNFKEGDLALFLPTRNQATRPWAAFNVGAPHYFLREQESHRLHNKEWLVARITRVEERIVDLSKSMTGTRGSDGRSFAEVSDSGISYEDDNPFELSDGLRWHLVEAAEEKVGAPLTPGLGKSTVHSTNIDAKGSIRMKKSLIGGGDASKTLNKSLDSRRSSQASRRSVPSSSSLPVRGASSEALGVETADSAGKGIPDDTQKGSRASSLRPVTSAGGQLDSDEVRIDQLLGP